MWTLRRFPRGGCLSPMNLHTTNRSFSTLQMFGTEHDWSFTDEGNPGMNGRKVGLARGKYVSKATPSDWYRLMLT